MAFLNERGFQTICLSRMLELIHCPSSLSGKPVAITFDDGFRSVYESALPVLCEYGQTATVFLSTGLSRPVSGDVRLPSSCGREMLSWDEIDELVAAGFELGAHTMTHPDLTSLDGEAVFREARGSKDIIEDRAGVEVDFFAYPYGWFDREVERIIAGIFKGACTVELALAGRGSDPWAMERVDAYYLRGERLFRVIDSSMLPWYLAARNVPRQIARRIERRR